jgi:hypothetical protein
MNKEQYIDSRQKEFLAQIPSVSIEHLYNNAVPGQPKYASEEVEKFYFSLAKEPLYPFVMLVNETLQITTVCPPIRGKHLQWLFHYAAASKRFGIDQADRRSDWRLLYTPSYKSLLEAHKHIPKWTEIFEQDREILDRFINEDYDQISQATDIIVPVIQITNKDGLEWDFSNINNQKIFSALAEYGYPQDPARFFPRLGPLFVAAFSPQITSSPAWGPRLNFNLNTEGGVTQDMGATQALALVHAKSEDLLSSTLVKNLIAYCTRTNRPKILE